MELFAKGQLSFLILNCLLDRDFYGLDIIEEIKNRTNGTIELKKPSVYSNLTRMEKQGLVTSYLRSSELGPNRRYYSITDKGEVLYKELEEDFSRNNLDVFKNYQQGKIELTSSENKEDSDREELFFDFSEISKEKTSHSPATDKEIQEYNKRIYDISKDINRFKKRRSFAEDQIAISVEAPLAVSEEKTRQKVEEFKASMLESKAKYSGRMTEEDFNNFRREYEPKEEKIDNIELETHSDGVFITEQPIQNIARPRKIEPPRLKIVAENREQSLPKPNRDKSIDPSHKEIISKLYAKTQNVAEDGYISDLEQLKEYYSNSNIKFKEYFKSSKTVHNTNKLYFYNSLISFIILALFSGFSYIFISKLSYVNPNTAFMFLLFPLLFLIDVGFYLFNYLRHTSWLPRPMMSQWLMWVSTFVAIAMVVGINYLFGFNGENISYFITSFVMPILTIILLLPVRYYTKRFQLIKYWK